MKNVFWCSFWIGSVKVRWGLKIKERATLKSTALSVQPFQLQIKRFFIVIMLFLEKYGIYLLTRNSNYNLYGMHRKINLFFVQNKILLTKFLRQFREVYSESRWLTSIRISNYWIFNFLTISSRSQKKMPAVAWWLKA